MEQVQQMQKSMNNLLFGAKGKEPKESDESSDWTTTESDASDFRAKKTASNSNNRANNDFSDSYYSTDEADEAEEEKAIESDDSNPRTMKTPKERKRLLKQQKLRRRRFHISSKKLSFLAFGIVCFAAGLGALAEVTRVPSDKKLSGKASMACMFSVSQLLWGFFGTVLLIVFQKGCCCTSCTPFTASSKRAIVLTLGWIFLLLSISLNLAALFLERSPGKTLPIGAHGITALLWLLCGVIYLVSYLITRKSAVESNELAAESEKNDEMRKRRKEERKKNRALARLNINNSNNNNNNNGNLGNQPLNSPIGSNPNPSNNSNISPTNSNNNNEGKGKGRRGGIA